MQEHGLQCGFCTPGMIVRAHRLLQENPNPSDEEIRWGLSGNLCRCTGYQNIVKAVRYAADKINAGRGGRRVMNDVKEMTLEEREATLGGIGSARKRKEDARFIRGQGNYVDDIKLPGMVVGDFVRSPYAHARSSRSTPRRPWPCPAWPRSSPPRTWSRWACTGCRPWLGDVAAVLADKKVHFQNQEVAFVVGADRYAVADGVQAVEVEYEELPVLVDPAQGARRTTRRSCARTSPGRTTSARARASTRTTSSTGRSATRRRPTPPSPRPR